MIARGLLGIVIGGFWSLATATVMRLVPEEMSSTALGIVYTGNAVATAFAAPIGTTWGGIIGWRGIFWALAPITMVNRDLAMDQSANHASADSKSRGKTCRTAEAAECCVRDARCNVYVWRDFAIFTYFWPFLNQCKNDVPQLSLVFLGLGMAGFIGTYGASKFTSRLFTACCRFCLLRCWVG